jgi:hypothetical protein
MRVQVGRYERHAQKLDRSGSSRRETLFLIDDVGFAAVSGAVFEAIRMRLSDGRAIMPPKARDVHELGIILKQRRQRPT